MCEQLTKISGSASTRTAKAATSNVMRGLDVFRFLDFAIGFEINHCPALEFGGVLLSAMVILTARINCLGSKMPISAHLSERALKSRGAPVPSKPMTRVRFPSPAPLSHPFGPNGRCAVATSIPSRQKPEPGLASPDAKRQMSMRPRSVAQWLEHRSPKSQTSVLPSPPWSYPV